MNKSCEIDKEAIDARTGRRQIYIMAAVLLLALVGYGVLVQSGSLAFFQDEQGFQAWLTRLGLWGPSAIVLLLTIAIVWSPIPSAPIALAAGAAYGHIWGALYVLIGAELGALVAFSLSRRFGYRLIKRWLGKRSLPTWSRSPDKLAWLVFVSRLLPFVSFDVISYAAGLTSLSIWRFALATLAGIAPASFLLAHFGSEMLSGNTQRIVIIGLLLIGLAAMPFLLYFARCSSAIHFKGGKV
jgi:uncharacterized membrane protein YdjX (TVP38/TMEM64 family)